ncbi:MAG: acyl-CoA carboxylase subunit epsilon [Herbiconiux sp.]|nr:acyl-CoA carboxylase subunit epsilon [Herbiconiux sp.]
MNESTRATAPEQGIRVLTRSVTAEELAAVTAVLEAAAEEELDSLEPELHIAPSAWERSQRTLREPLHPGAGVWRSFAG